ncbi:hypothetical protein PR202_ga04747 [Eleusine coracana subsp. coracana]|uniref:non-specific serine/threonine protein kinase n=1 Tax=Eleusine coracana subsp. coracana TaxID=191504 RepID=A0AAV5BST0_ELECO|nr:hypothetical protein PR202_ga04747 [Eleusine coracana subsp. coracana]
MMAAGRPLSGDRKLVSRGGKFALGFFKPAGISEEGAVDRWYVGIWYHKIPVRTPVWVANRDRPVSDPAASRLTIAPDGNLVMLDPSGSSAWSTNASARSFANVVVAVLLDTGNLVLAPSSNASDVLWQSFDHVGDTWLPGAKVRRDKVTGLFHGMTSWKSYGDPALGAYTLQLDPTGAPRYMLLRKRNGTLAYYTGIGDWNGLTFPGDAGYSFSFVDNDRDSYFAYGFVDNSIMYRFVMDVFGQVKGLVWVEDTQAWNQVFAVPMRQCDVPQRCGAFGVCTEGAPTVCRCLEGFSPRDVAGWSLGDYSGGCVRNTELQCGDSADRLKEKDSFFLMYYHVSRRLPDNGDRGVAAGASSSGDCEQACRVDCACSAYAYKRNCILWQNDLLNLEDTYFKREADVGDLYIRLATSSEPPVPGVRNYKRRTDEITVGAFAIVCLVVVTSVIIVGTTMSRRRAKKVQCLEGCVASFTYRELKSFTNKFSDKLGGGAFGSVFRGQLPDRTTTIAVKKLEGLRQGEKQFRAEVSTLGTIHHVNLIRLLGFCSGSGDRNKLLVYEYMSNGSLDRHLFGATPHALSWRTRYQVAVGVAKGLCYLHDKCRDCIIHCDVKPENVLLDVAFEPKIADFGLAKLMGRPRFQRAC